VSDLYFKGKSASLAIAAKSYQLSVRTSKYERTIRRDLNFFQILQCSIGDLVIEYPNQLEKGFMQLIKRARKQKQCISMSYSYQLQYAKRAIITSQLIVVLDNIELMFPKSGLFDTHLEMVALNQLQDTNERYTNHC
jgi:hypothetical protein